MFSPWSLFSALFTQIPYANPKEDICPEGQPNDPRAGHVPAGEERYTMRDSQGHQNYDIIQVVALHWRGTDQEVFREEAEMVVEISKRLGWAATKLSIPPDGKIRDLIRQTLDFSPQKGEKGLFILHYGGHGSKVRRTMQGAPSRHGFGDPEIDWRTVQSIFKEHVDYDMLGVLDGCDLGFEGWKDKVGEYNGRCLEILTAGGNGVKTPGAGDPKSFTPIFLKELEAAIKEEVSITVDRLRHRLISLDQLVVDPNWLGGSKEGERKIHLSPLRSHQQPPQQYPASSPEVLSTPSVDFKTSFIQEVPEYSGASGSDEEKSVPRQTDPWGSFSLF